MGSFLYLFFSEYPSKLSQGVILSYSKSFFFAYHQMTTWSALWEGLTVNIFDRSDSLTKKKKNQMNSAKGNQFILSCYFFSCFVENNKENGAEH